MLRSPLAEEISRSGPKDTSYNGSDSSILQKRKKIAQQALNRLNRILGGVLPFVILRIRIRDIKSPFSYTELPAPVRVVYRSGDLLLDFPCHFGDDTDKGIARNGGQIILKALHELKKSSIDIRNCSIFFIP
ncbi:MAG: hypothetical protein ACE5OZ_05725 [Candidatus Heimdallarchaeota archaeon]